MVTFNCEVCNDTVPKKNTEKHYYRCPDAYYTCIDCNKTFDDGVSYKKHIQCISEDEKYQKTLFKGKKKQSVPDTKQTTKQASNSEKKNTQKEAKKLDDHSRDASKKQVTKAASPTILKKGANLYKILKTVKDKDEKKKLLKKLIVNQDGHLVLQE